MKLLEDLQMENKTELVEKLAMMQKHVAELENLIASMPDEPQKWEPKGGNWYVDSSGEVLRGRTRVEARNFGLEYSTKEAAEKARDAMRAHNRLLAWLAENDDGWVADWDDKNQEKYSIAYTCKSNSWTYWNTTFYKITGVVYMSEANAEKFCKLLNDGVVEL